MLENKHSFTEFRMMAEVNNPQHLNVFENMYTFIRQRELTIKNKIQWTFLHMNSECIYIPSYEKPAGFQCHFFGFHSCRSKQKNTIRYCIHDHKEMSLEANLINFKRILISISFSFHFISHIY